jgi:hypothetical protein
LRGCNRRFGRNVVSLLLSDEQKFINTASPAETTYVRPGQRYFETLRKDSLFHLAGNVEKRKNCGREVTCMKEDCSHAGNEDTLTKPSTHLFNGALVDIASFSHHSARSQNKNTYLSQPVSGCHQSTYCLVTYPQFELWLCVAGRMMQKHPPKCWEGWQGVDIYWQTQCMKR